MDFDEFCDVVRISDLKEVEKAVHFLWFELRAGSTESVNIDVLIQRFQTAHLPLPNRTRLIANLKHHPGVRSKIDVGKNEFALVRDQLKKLNAAFPEPKTGVALIASPLIDNVKRHLSNVQDPTNREFLAEAVTCLEQGLKRAAIVLSWQGAYFLLINQAFKHHLVAFNRAARASNYTKKNIDRLEQFQRLKESEALIALEQSGVISKAVKTALEECLNRRNNCGHPNDFKVTEAQVAAHIESLIAHVFDEFN